MNNIDFELPEGTESSNLFKLHPPFQKLIDGHGYPGVILQSNSSWLAPIGWKQCHICGNWFNCLPQHIRHEHKITVEIYRRKFGLRKKDSLVSSKTHDKHSKHSKKENIISKLKNQQKKGSQNNANNGLIRSKQSSYSKNTLAALNQRGLCPDQINHRFDIIENQVGRQPSQRDVEKYDVNLLNVIKRKFGKFNNYIEQRGLVPRSNHSGTPPNKTTDTHLIASIRLIYLKFGIVKIQNFNNGNGTPSWPTIQKRFGNLENACREAGIDPSNWSMVG